MKNYYNKLFFFKNDVKGSHVNHSPDKGGGGFQSLLSQLRNVVTGGEDERPFGI